MTAGTKHIRAELASALGPLGLAPEVIRRILKAVMPTVNDYARDLYATGHAEDPSTDQAKPAATAAEFEAIRKATAATLRTVAQWVPHIGADDIVAVARELDLRPVDDLPGWACPVCQEVICDDGCPLEPIRHPAQREDPDASHVGRDREPDLHRLP